LELRIAAEFSQDQNMLGAFHGGIDLHAKNAAGIEAELQGLPEPIPIEDVTPEMRKKSKTATFKIQYGGREDLEKGITEHYLEQYFKVNSEFKSYMDDHAEMVGIYGFTQTVTGRKRRDPRAFSRQPWVVAKAERALFSGNIQGSGADVVKIAMIDIYNYIQENKIDAHIIAQVHDELLIECADEYVEEMTRVVRELMEGVGPKLGWGVPLTADPGVGLNWAEAKV
jgi:DNA polymerase-1